MSEDQKEQQSEVRREDHREHRSEHGREDRREHQREHGREDRREHQREHGRENDNELAIAKAMVYYAHSYTFKLQHIMPAPNELTDAQLLESRELLLSLLSSGKEKKVSQKESLRKILSTVIACHKAGISFEAMQTLLTRAGWTITVESLRRYYFDLRKELELSVAEKTQAKKIASAKAAIQRKLILRHTHELEMAGQTSLIPGKTGSTAVSIHSIVSTSTEKENSKDGIQRKAAKAGNLSSQKEEKTNTQILPEALRTTAPAPVIHQEDKGGANAEAISNVLANNDSPEDKLQASENNNSPENDAPAGAISDEAPTLEQLEAIRIEKEKDPAFDHAPLAEDVILRDGRVYFASGKPFVGTLSAKQLYLLPMEERLFAPTPSRTSKDFVKMPRKL